MPETPNARALDRRRTADRVREILVDRILDGTLAPGDRIVELDVARELDTSQAPVREALRELQGLRLVTLKPYKGACVREVDEDELLESFEIRSILERFAARGLGDEPRRCVVGLEAIQARMREAADDADVVTFVRHDVAFHRTIVEAADHGTLLRTWDSLGVEVGMRLLLARSGTNLHAAAEAHIPIVEAFRLGDAELAGRLLRSHPETVYGPGWPSWPRTP